ncbi:MAG: 50S ribosomal protein L20 [Elusimicrobiota bacterium]
MRIKSGVYSRHRKKKVFRIAKSYYSDRGRRWRLVKQQVDRSLRFAYISRKNQKRVMRSLWITRINAATRKEGISYSVFISTLKKNNINLNRKSLAHLAVHDPKNFEALVHLAKDSAEPAVA